MFCPFPTKEGTQPRKIYSLIRGHKEVIISWYLFQNCIYVTVGDTLLMGNNKARKYNKAPVMLQACTISMVMLVIMTKASHTEWHTGNRVRKPTKKDNDISC